MIEGLSARVAIVDANGLPTRRFIAAFNNAVPTVVDANAALADRLSLSDATTDATMARVSAVEGRVAAVEKDARRVSAVEATASGAAVDALALAARLDAMEVADCWVRP